MSPFTYELYIYEYIIHHQVSVLLYVFSPFFCDYQLSDILGDNDDK